MFNQCQPQEPHELGAYCEIRCDMNERGIGKNCRLGERGRYLTCKLHGSDCIL